MFSPLYCHALTNENLESVPELINSSPYEKGWIIKVELSNPSEVEELLNSKDYEGLIK